MSRSRLLICMVLVCALVVPAALVAGCSQGKVPVVETISPAKGEPGTLVTITGKYFGETEGTGEVGFGPTTADAESWSDTKITLKVPEDVEPGDHLVTVTTEAGTSARQHFDVTGPGQMPQRKEGQVEHTTATDAILDYCSKNNIDTTGMSFTVLKVSKTDPNFKINGGRKAGDRDIPHQFLMRNVNENWMVIDDSETGWTADELKNLDAPADLADAGEPAESQVNAVVDYLTAKGEASTGWTLTVVKTSAENPDWDVIKGEHEQKTTEFVLVWDDNTDKYVVVASGSPPWTNVEYNGQPIPSDLVDS